MRFRLRHDGWIIDTLMDHEVSFFDGVGVVNDAYTPETHIALAFCEALNRKHL